MARSFDNRKKRAVPLRRWLTGLNVPEIIRELALMQPFIFSCCKVSIYEQKWVAPPSYQKAVIVKDFNSYKLCDGEYWVEFSPNDDVRPSLMCGNKFRTWNVCFFIVVLRDYSFSYDSKSNIFIANCDEFELVRETHCLEKAFTTVPHIMTVKEELFKDPTISSQIDLLNQDIDKDSDGPTGIPSGRSSQMGQELDDLSGVDAQASTRFENSWIPTQNCSSQPTEEVISYPLSVPLASIEPSLPPGVSEVLPPEDVQVKRSGMTEEIALDRPLVPTTRSKTASGVIDAPLLPGCNSSSSISQFGAQNGLLVNLSSVPVPVDVVARSNPLYWFGPQRDALERCFLGETFCAIDELNAIMPAQSFSDFFKNFAFED